jgi:hypothetical protein
MRNCTAKSSDTPPPVVSPQAAAQSWPTDEPSISRAPATRSRFLSATFDGAQCFIRAGASRRRFLAVSLRIVSTRLSTNLRCRLQLRRRRPRPSEPLPHAATHCSLLASCVIAFAHATISITGAAGCASSPHSRPVQFAPLHPRGWNPNAQFLFFPRKCIHIPLPPRASALAVVKQKELLIIQQP